MQGVPQVSETTTPGRPCLVRLSRGPSLALADGDIYYGSTEHAAFSHLVHELAWARRRGDHALRPASRRARSGRGRRSRRGRLAVRARGVRFARNQGLRTPRSSELRRREIAGGPIACGGAGLQYAVRAAAASRQPRGRGSAASERARRRVQPLRGDFCSKTGGSRARSTGQAPSSDRLQMGHCCGRIVDDHDKPRPSPDGSVAGAVPGGGSHARHSRTRVSPLV